MTSVLVAAAVTADTDDHYKPPNTVIKSTSTKAVSKAASGVSLTCTNSTTSGRTPATGLGLFPTSAPKFNDGYSATGAPKPCTDSAGGTDVITTTGTWQAGFVDAAGDETAAEPNTGDRFRIVIPKAGAVDHNSFGCVITLAPTAAFALVGLYNDVNKLTINVTNVPASITGPSFCMPGTHTGGFQAVYTLSPGLADAS
jgi:hypothetical protein